MSSLHAQRLSRLEASMGVVPSQLTVAQAAKRVLSAPAPRTDTPTAGSLLH